MPASVHGPRPLACAPRARALHVSVTLRVARVGDPKWMCNLCMLANRLCPECRESALSCACMHAFIGGVANIRPLLLLGNDGTPTIVCLAPP